VELAEIDSRVGLFFNMLPMRVRIDTGAPMLPWLRELQEQTLAARRFEYTPLERLHHWFYVPRSEPFFSTYLVFEIFPTDPDLARRAASLWSSCTATGHGQTEHTLRVELVTGPQLTCNILYYKRDFARDTVATILDTLMGVLEMMAADLSTSAPRINAATALSA
jgi:hypothetical protein